MNINSKTKFWLIVAGVIAAIILLVVIMFTTTNNKAVVLEEQINGAVATIKVQEKRRVDLIYNLVDAVKDYNDYESSTLVQITEARAQATAGNVEGAQAILTSIAEQYPELKANENYKEVMNELSTTENMIQQSRDNYNAQVKAYNKFARTFPNTLILGMSGYEKIDFQYTDYGAPSDAPQGLFD